MTVWSTAFKPEGSQPAKYESMGSGAKALAEAKMVGDNEYVLKPQRPTTKCGRALQYSL